MRANLRTYERTRLRTYERTRRLWRSRPRRRPRGTSRCTGACSPRRCRASRQTRSTTSSAARAPSRSTRRVPPPVPPRTKWTRRVPHPVLIGHAASVTLLRRARQGEPLYTSPPPPPTVAPTRVPTVYSLPPSAGRTTSASRQGPLATAVALHDSGATREGLEARLASFPAIDRPVSGRWVGGERDAACPISTG